MSHVNNIPGNLVRNDAANTYSTGAQDFSSATSLIVKAAASFAPTANGSFGQNTTNGDYVVGADGETNFLPMCPVILNFNESLTNSTASDQDYTSTIYTIPANWLITGKAILATFGFFVTTGVSGVTLIRYLKVGSTKVATTQAVNLGDSKTAFSYAASYLILGTAAAGASVNVDTFPQCWNAVGISDMNQTSQPIALATNGTLAITPGVTYSGTGSTETHVLRFAMIQKLAK